MNTHIKNALFILAVVGIAKFINSKLPNNPLDAFIPD